MINDEDKAGARNYYGMEVTVKEIGPRQLYCHYYPVLVVSPPTRADRAEAWLDQLLARPFRWLEAHPRLTVAAVFVVACLTRLAIELAMRLK